jgi:DNA invertase Pin-like site-specific DNA recombinase
VDKAYSYLRFSTLDQQQGDSFRRQTQLAEAYAAEHGLDLDDTLTFQDLGVSAYRSRNSRQGALRAFLDAAEEGTIARGSYLLVESLDRISRDQILAAQGLFFQIIQAGVTLVTLADRKVYSEASINANPTDLILSLVVMMRANEESVMKASRLQAAWAGKRARAAEKPLTSVCPAWMRLEDGRFVLIDDRAAIVQRLFTEAAAGKGQHAIAEGLNREGVVTFGHRGRQGTQWHRSYVAKLLASCNAVGIYVPHRMDYAKGKPRRIPQDPVPGYYPAVVDPDLWEQVQAIRRGSHQPLRGRHANAGVVRNILGGLARCPLCGSTMTRLSKGGRWVYLVCTKAKAGAGCEYHAVPYETVEQGILKGVDKVEHECPTGNPEMDAVGHQIDAMDEQVSVLQDEVGRLVTYAGRSRSPAIAQQVVELERAIDDTRKRQRDLGRSLSFALPGRIGARLGAFREACKALEHGDGADADGALRGAVNAALRSLCGSVEVDYQQGVLVLHFLHGGAVGVTYDYLFKRAG